MLAIVELVQNLLLAKFEFTYFFLRFISCISNINYFFI